RVTSPEAWTYTWRYFIDSDRLDQAGAGDLAAGLQRLALLFPSTATRVTTGLTDLLQRFAVQRQLAVSVLTLAAVGLVAAAAAVALPRLIARSIPTSSPCRSCSASRQAWSSCGWFRS